MWKIDYVWRGRGLLGSNPLPHRHVPFTFFPKIYTKNAIPAVKSNLKVIKVLGNKTEISYIYHRIQWYSM
jgi:hypothetical protein